MDHMHNWEPPEDVRLSARERLALLEIEADLKRDRRLAHRMGEESRGASLPLAVLLLAAASVFVAVAGVRTSDAALLWCFVLLWPLTLLQAFRLLCRTVRHHHRGGDRAARPWHGG